MNGLTARVSIVAALVFAAGQLGAREPRPVPLRAPLSAFPATLGGWHEVEEPPLDPDTLRVLGADDHLSRLYARGGALASVYVGYYDTLRAGGQIHSPRNCLPGNGWQPADRSTPAIDLGDGTVPVNRFVVSRDGSRQLVIYWFDGRGRVVANEYANKWLLLRDSWTRGRSESALVRLIAPLAPVGLPSDDPAVDAALRQLGRLVHLALNRGWLP